MDEAESLLSDARAKKKSILTDKVSGENIYKALIFFDRLYEKMTETERRNFYEKLIKEIQIYEERQPNGQWLKSIEFKLPIIEHDIKMSLDNSDSIETVVQLSKVSISSNRCILPEGWTAETLMQPHDSIPYNPDIANVFFRAGYIENWGQGIQKICDECIALGAELPRYEILGTGIRVYFPALRSALIDQPKVPKGHSAKNDGTLDDTMALKIIEIIRSKPDITLDQLSAEAGIARRTLVRYMSALKEAGRIERVGGKRYGHWEINEYNKAVSSDGRGAALFE